MADTADARARGLSEAFIAQWEKSPWKDFYERHKNELFLGIRLGYVNLYYEGARISKIELQNGRLVGSVNPKYLEKSGEKPVKIEPKELEPFEEIKNRIHEKYRLAEKESQHKLALNNNHNRRSEWYCVDIEYIKSNQGGMEVDIYGRFDMIAVAKNDPGKTALIELKCSTKAIGGSSGVNQHIGDFYKFWIDSGAKERLGENLRRTIDSQRRLLGADYPFDEHYTKNFEFRPEFYFISTQSDLGGRKDARVQMRKYLLDVPGASKGRKGAPGYNVMIDGAIIKHKDKNGETKERKKIDVIKGLVDGKDCGFKPLFLFTDDDGGKIDEIIGSDLYVKGLLDQ